ncbi:MAG: hypothetical protein JJU24_08450 [Natronohydrobacter sp.]|nr:hypothetical protein [Natronohydrobacter sp.]
MIHAVVIFLSLPGPVATFKSADSFADPGACIEHLQEEAPRIAEVAVHLSRELGIPIRDRTLCVLIQQGVAA